MCGCVGGCFAFVAVSFYLFYWLSFFRFIAPSQFPKSKEGGAWGVVGCVWNRYNTCIIFHLEGNRPTGRQTHRRRDTEKDRESGFAGCVCEGGVREREGGRNCEGRNGQNEELKLFCILLTLPLPTNFITDAVSSRDHSPGKADQTKISAPGTLYDVRSEYVKT